MNTISPKPVISKAPHAPMRIGKRHDPEDELVVSRRSSSAGITPRADAAANQDAAGSALANTPQPDPPLSARR